LLCGICHFIVSKLLRPTHFNKSWIQEPLFSSWLLAVKDDSSKAYCKICKCEFSIIHKGRGDLIRHAEREKHVSSMKQLESQPRFSFSAESTGILFPSASPVVIKFTHDDYVAKAEILELLHLVKFNLSFSSCNDLMKKTQLAYPDSKIGKDATLASTKASYSISHGLGPYFHKLTLSELANQYFCLLFDETTNEADHK